MLFCIFFILTFKKYFFLYTCIISILYTSLLYCTFSHYSIVWQKSQIWMSSAAPIGVVECQQDSYVLCIQMGFALSIALAVLLSFHYCLFCHLLLWPFQTSSALQVSQAILGGLHHSFGDLDFNEESLNILRLNLKNC